MQKVLGEKIVAGPSGRGQRIWIVCPYADAPQEVVWARFSKEASASGEQGFLQGLFLRKFLQTTTENDGFTLIFPHSEVENAPTASKAFLLLWVGGGHDQKSGDFVTEQVGFAVHHKLLGAGKTTTIYGKRTRSPLRNRGKQAARTEQYLGLCTYQ